MKTEPGISKAARRAAKAETKLVKAEAKLAKAEAKLEARRARVEAAKKIYNSALADARHAGVYEEHNPITA